ncbi:MAG: C25 family cysteine peptidase [Candidatus Omnitrophica bacterium]|nr:C25 family cysteine peptidase [Candidatus Omnitrophota bacterium]
MESGSFIKRIFIPAFFVLFLLTVCSTLTASQSAKKSFTLNIRSNVVTTNIESVDLTKINGYTRVRISGLSNFALPGQPLLPIKTVRFLLPYGKDINDVQLSSSNRKIIYGSYYVEPAQQPIPLSFKGVVKPTALNSAIYNSTDPFPGKQYELVSVQNLRGFKIAVINLFPVEYIPVTGQLAYYENMTISLILESTNDVMPYDLYRGIESDREMVSESVDNPEAVGFYPANSAAPLAAVDYLIITSDAYASYSGANSLSDLAAHKQSKGLTTSIVNATSWGTYSGSRPDGGSDNATKIRNCILDNYNTNGTQYVLLVGDADYGDADSGGSASGEREAAPIIPVRMLKVSSTDIAADLYYACLGGTFDFDADGVYGETTDGAAGSDVDLEAEVFVGRAPVDSTIELSNFVKKTIAYENSTSSYLTKVIMAGEDLGWDPATYGGDYMDEIKNGTSANGYTTRGMANTGCFSFDLLYDKISVWATATLVTKLNAGIHVLNHLGHASNTLLGKTFSNTDADGLTNTDYFFGYSQGCYSGAFDNCNSYGGYETSDCILEHFVTEANGAFAFIGNSRYGWGSEGSTDGPSQHFHREFWDAVVYEGKKNLAKAMQDSKQDNIGLVAVDGAYRWSYFCINLLGDPHTPVNAEFLAPTDFSATNVFVANKSWVSLRWVNSSEAALTQTMIRYRTDGVYPVSSTDGTLLTERSATPGAADLVNHTNVENGKTYHYTAFGYDGSSYEGVNAVKNRAYVTVIGGSSGTSTGRSDCFIATVCYGSKESKEVNTLRNFRDRVLVNTFTGKQFIAAYYIIGPKLSRWIEDKEDFKKIIRKCLNPIVSCVARLMGGN